MNDFAELSVDRRLWSGFLSSRGRCSPRPELRDADSGIDGVRHRRAMTPSTTSTQQGKDSFQIGSLM